MAVVIAREVRDGESVGVGVNSPIPAAGALLARHLHAPRAALRLRGVDDAVPFVGSKEFFDFAQRGRLDLFFLSGIQIDARGASTSSARPDAAFPALSARPSSIPS